MRLQAPLQVYWNSDSHVWGLQAKAQAATKGTNLVDVESERVKEVVPKAGSMELLGHEDHQDAAASGTAPEAPFSQAAHWESTGVLQQASWAASQAVAPTWFGLMALSRMPLLPSAPVGSPHLMQTSERLIDSLRVLHLPCYLCQP